MEQQVMDMVNIMTELSESNFEKACDDLRSNKSINQKFVEQLISVSSSKRK